MPFPNLVHGSTMRDNLLLRILRGIQLAMAIVILAVSATNVSSWHDLGCTSPGKIDYNLAAAVLSIFALIYLLLSTGAKRVNAIPWHPFGQLGIDVFLLILWIAAAATSSVSCDDACSACKSIGAEYDSGCGFTVYYGDALCNCYFSSDDACIYYSKNKHKRAMLDASEVFEKRARTSSSFKGVKNGGKIGVNVIELILFVLSTAATAYLIYRQRKAASTEAPAVNAPAPTSQETKIEPPQPAPVYAQGAPSMGYQQQQQQQQYQQPYQQPPQQQYAPPQQQQYAPVSPVQQESQYAPPSVEQLEQQQHQHDHHHQHFGSSQQIHHTASGPATEMPANASVPPSYATGPPGQ